MSDYPGSCQHVTVSRPRARTVANGSIQYRRQCLDCGDAIGNPVSKQSALQQTNGTPKIFDEALAAQGIENFRRARIQHLEEESAEWFAWYNIYLESQTWRDKRQRVIERCGGVCEGCRAAHVKQVHHLTYKHVGRELLYELVGLCDGCHEVAHAENETAMPQAVLDLEWEKRWQERSDPE